MAGFNQILAARYPELVRRLLRLTDAGISVVAPELQTNLILENDRPEWMALTGTRLAGGFIAQAAVAANNSKVALVNPAGSGLLIVVTSVMFRTGGALVIEARMAGALGAFVGSATGAYRDTRWQGQVPVGVMRAEATLTTEGLVVGQTVSNAINLQLSWRHGPWVLAPGTSLLFRGLSVNVLLEASFEWYERPASQAELALA